MVEMLGFEGKGTCDLGVLGWTEETNVNAGGWGYDGAVTR
ncbi:hypothetical protein TIFTF001_046070 [Ficus carica]|uniref:Uncharacterized protein n=1 Tax=Ficus carica TaxID=3494 RepID=A0AA87ZHQ5_FICCA|nr:hypothetical protein TIFTF001_046065 [Ficus carica]GMN26593.1 hypothetical protein TIFTF001_046070 [Ficus carica]